MIKPDTNNIKPNKCCEEENLEFDCGDGIEWEVWICEKCKLKYLVPIQIQRYWEDMEQVVEKEDYNNE